MGSPAEFKRWGTAEPSLLPDAATGAARAKKPTCSSSIPSFSNEAEHLFNSLFLRDISRQSVQAEHYLCLTTQKAWKAKVKGDRLHVTGLTLSVKLLADPLTPLFAQVPEPARVANVSTLECNLKGKKKSSSEKRNYCLAVLRQQICRPHQQRWDGLRSRFREPASPKYAFWGKNIHLSCKQNFHSALRVTVVRTRGGPNSKAAKSFWILLASNKPTKASGWLLLTAWLSIHGWWQGRAKLV